MDLTSPSCGIYDQSKDELVQAYRADAGVPNLKKYRQRVIGASNGTAAPYYRSAANDSYDSVAAFTQSISGKVVSNQKRSLHLAVMDKQYKRDDKMYTTLGIYSNI